MPPTIRPERPEDLHAVLAVHRQAFQTDAEARLVHRARLEVSGRIGLVACSRKNVLGHILFTPVALDGAPHVKAMGLGPVAVLPSRQKEGIGTELITKGLDTCRQQGVDAVFVLGHPGYYPRFGFEPASTHGFSYRDETFAPYFFVLPCNPDLLTTNPGQVRYHRLFDEV